MTSAAQDAVESRVIRLSYGVEKANAYMLTAADGSAVLIDACSPELVSELQNRRLVPFAVILTHEHCDHIWGLNALREAYPEMRLIAHSRCSRAIGNPRDNKARQYHVYMALRYGSAYRRNPAQATDYRCEKADICFDTAYQFSWKGLSFHCVHTPGHSPGSALITVNGAFVFSGDTILPQADPFLKLDGGDALAYEKIAKPILDSLPDESMVFPGHGDRFTMKEWRRRHNGEYAGA